jgi:hypothetical protein
VARLASNSCRQAADSGRVPRFRVYVSWLAAGWYQRSSRVRHPCADISWLAAPVIHTPCYFAPVRPPAMLPTSPPLTGQTRTPCTAHAQAQQHTVSVGGQCL